MHFLLRPLHSKILQIQPFRTADLAILPEFQPPGWFDLTPRFQWFLDTPWIDTFALWDSGEIASTGAILYSGDCAWLACIITHPVKRNQGHGLQMTRFLVEQCRNNGYETIYLVATPMGFPVYRKLGFEQEAIYRHYKFTSPEDAEIVEPVRAMLPTDMPAVSSLDFKLTGEKRFQLLKHFTHQAYVYETNGNIRGYYLPELVEGPILATDEEAGMALMKLRMGKIAYAALPEQNIAGISFYESQNLPVIQTSVSMRLGPARIKKYENMYNRISGMLG